MPERLHRALSGLVDLLDARAEPYMIIGALAVAMWGRPRATADIDVTVLTDAAGLEAIGGAAARQGFTVDEPWLQANPLLRGQHMRLTRGDVVVDVMRPRDAHEEAALGRCRRLPIAERAVPVVAPDDLILMKLKAGRPRDFEDSLGVLVAQRPELDEGYMRGWARRLGIVDELVWLLDAATGEGPAAQRP